MSMTTEQKRASLATGLALAALLHTLRVALPTALPATAGFSPVGAAALFAGAALPGAGAGLLTTIGGLVLGDLAILALVYRGEHGFPIYAGWAWVYGSLALMALLGRLLSGDKFGWRKAGGLALTGTLTHWLITNTGVWLAAGIDLTTGHPYTRDFSGYAACLAQAIPYELRFLTGTLSFGAAAFALHRLALGARDAKAATRA